MSMDLGQLSQMITWLDEELRGRKAELTQVQQRLGGQEAQLHDQARALKELLGGIAGSLGQQVAHLALAEGDRPDQRVQELAG